MSSVVKKAAGNVEKDTGRIGGAFKGAVKIAAGAVVGFGAAVVGVSSLIAGLAIKGGISRALNIEDAQAKLKGLGHDVEAIDAIMGSALDSVKGTAFGLDSAATSAAAAVAAGVKPGEDLTRVLGLTADAATIMGRSFGDSGSIINKVLASNRLSMEEVNQLHDAGLPILSMLAEQYGVTAEEMRKMISEGVVGSEEFLAAMENNIAGAALESGSTTRGAFANMGAAMSRWGETIVKPLMPLVKNVFVGMTEVWDNATDAMKPLMEQFQKSDVFKKLEDASKDIPGIFERMVDRGRPLVEWAKDMFEKAKDLFGSLKDGKNPLEGVTSAFMILGGPMMLLAREILPRIEPAFSAIIPPLAELANDLAPVFAELIVTLVDNLLPGLLVMLDGLIGFLAGNGGLVKALGLAVVAFKILTLVMATNPFILIATAVIAIAALIITNWDTIKKFLSDTWEKIKRVASTVWDAIKGFFSRAVDFIKNLFLNFTPLGLFIKHMDTMKDAVLGVKDWIVDKFNAVVDFFKKLPGRIGDAVSGMWDGIKNAFKAAINWVIDKWNNFEIKGGFDLPGILGGGRVEFGFETPNLPRLHDGGVFRAPPGQREGLALLADGERVTSADGGGGNVFHITPNGQDPFQIADEIAWKLLTSGV